MTEYLTRYPNWRLYTMMPDGKQWSVPVIVIAVNHAQHYANEFGSLDRSLEETISLFDDDPSEIADWASNNMNWLDVSAYARLEQAPPTEVDYQEGWLNGDKIVVGNRAS